MRAVNAEVKRMRIVNAEVKLKRTRTFNAEQRMRTANAQTILNACAPITPNWLIK